MAKAAKTQQTASTMKPKFQQTKLCFASFSTAAPVTTSATTTKKAAAQQVEANYTKVLEKSIKALDIGNSVNMSREQHPDPCKDCNKNVKHIQCTALRPNTKMACGLSYCTECVYKEVRESLEWIAENKEAQFVDKNGDVIQHVKSETQQPKWACPVCRGLCECELCTGSSKQNAAPKTQLSFNIEPTNTTTNNSSSRKKTSTIVNIEPPSLTPIKLLYSEEEIWIRLQVREFLFRFGDLYGFDNRMLSGLQNVQGDWRIKKFGAYIVWQFLMILVKTTNYELPLHRSTEEMEEDQDVVGLARKIMHSWIKDKKLDNVYIDRESKYQALLDVLQTEGMTPKRWQDIAELLALAEFKDIPVPTSRDIIKSQQEGEEEEVDNGDRMDIDDEEEEEQELFELNNKIRKYQKNTSRSNNLISATEELIMINMLLELLLFDVQIRQSLVAAGKNSTTKELRDEELEFKKYRKEWKEENAKHVINRTSLSNRIYQLEATKGKQAELQQARADLDALETLIRDEQHNLAKKKLELTIHTLKQEKRMKSIGCDMLQNEYWIFNDILDHLNNATDYRSSETYWAYGVVIIRPGFQSGGNNRRQWWYIKGKEDLKKLKDYIVNESKKEQEKENIEELKRIANGINYRIEYLVSLETCVYGEGFFK